MNSFLLEVEEQCGYDRIVRSLSHGEYRLGVVRYEIVEEAVKVDDGDGRVERDVPESYERAPGVGSDAGHDVVQPGWQFNSL